MATDTAVHRSRSPQPEHRALGILMVLIVMVIGCTSAPGSAPPSTRGVPATAQRTAASEMAAPSPTSTASSPHSEAVGAMSVPRAAHTATLLETGQVLLTGGCIRDSCEGITDSSELFDPARGATTAGPAMLEPRVGHTAVGLTDGRVLLLGGFGESAVTAGTELYDPKRQAFVAGPAMSTPRADSLGVRLPDGTVLVVGGFDGAQPLATAELFDPGTGTFRAVASMGEARLGSAGALLSDGRVLVVGGRDGDRGTVRASAEIYDPAADTWTQAADLSTRRHKHAVVALEDGRALVAGGSDERDGHGLYRSTELFDPASASFAPGPDLGEARYKIVNAVVALGDGSVLVGGGGHRAEILDPAGERFAPVGPDLGGAWSFATATLLADGAVLLAGGYDARIMVTDRMHLYPPTTAGG